MSARPKNPPSLTRLLSEVPGSETQPAAYVLAGHNGSGKSTLWHDRLAPSLQMPLLNADRLAEAILPPRDPTTQHLPEWAQQLRNEDPDWQRVSQRGVEQFRKLAVEGKLAFAFETVFSDWREQADGTVQSKIDVIRQLQAAGYFVVLFFVGLASVDVSILRVQTRVAKGGHGVPLPKLIDRFPRTQHAIGHAALVADMTLMFDNSRGLAEAFTLARVQRKSRVSFDCRDPNYKREADLVTTATLWLDKVVGPMSAS